MRIPKIGVAREQPQPGPLVRWKYAPADPLAAPEAREALAADLAAWEAEHARLAAERDQHAADRPALAAREAAALAAEDEAELYEVTRAQRAARRWLADNRARLTFLEGKIVVGAKKLGRPNPLAPTPAAAAAVREAAERARSSNAATWDEAHRGAWKAYSRRASLAGAVGPDDVVRLPTARR